MGQSRPVPLASELPSTYDMQRNVTPRSFVAVFLMIGKRKCLPAVPLYLVTNASPHTLRL